MLQQIRVLFFNHSAVLIGAPQLAHFGPLTNQDRSFFPFFMKTNPIIPRREFGRYIEVPDFTIRKTLEGDRLPHYPVEEAQRLPGRDPGDEADGFAFAREEKLGPVSGPGYGYRPVSNALQSQGFPSRDGGFFAGI